MIKELKEFLFKGNVLDLAVAVILGAAFNAIITSLVKDVITPLILNPVLKAAGVSNIAQLSWNGVAYGNFLSAVINFLIVGTTLFFIVKAANKVMAKKPAEEEIIEVVEPTQEQLLAEIRDLLANK
ncbi:TPA: large conductance mechanosensitive channel protein MscL [Streptococcus agalactiae]|jgi:large conductance mechanosensitive channel protein|uniref:Large-conductance mechanosensitive channel n=8 Tax=Streptococcus agalactiae TaxID=1311 RepID=Q8DYP6_STRA5|nr:MULTISPECIES: large conductance mechanosensitive channel protein MscL [Streptococcus]AHN30740.1 large-conductance mechanosensitive channel [Streptococcus agalactiae 138P]EAO61681.1 large conductance mechanosensitive channel protein [Streptococcus agalactiae 18RS21]EAO77271.1 large conductance mechanosensitive channel protein [Streptococcus agalactiae H36B]EJZ03038.1 large-conductance mechanosensitive channel [Streptococcus agalactiae STIR-CD-17]EPT70578.1 large-conductance mechanosensitive 